MHLIWMYCVVVSLTEMEWICGKVCRQWRGVHRSQGPFTEQTYLLTQVGWMYGHVTAGKQWPKPKPVSSALLHHSKFTTVNSFVFSATKIQLNLKLWAERECFKRVLKMFLTRILLVFHFRTVRSNSRVKSVTPNNEKESTTNDNGSSTDEAESEGNNRWVACHISKQQKEKVMNDLLSCNGGLGKDKR